MAESGLMVEGWPLVLGCDASGVVVKTGKDASSTFKVGDEVCGVPRLGLPGYGTCQEYVWHPAVRCLDSANALYSS